MLPQVLWNHPLEVSGKRGTKRCKHRSRATGEGYEYICLMLRIGYTRRREKIIQGQRSAYFDVR